MAKYRLIKAQKTPVTLYNVAKTKVLNNKSIVTYSNFIRLSPNEEYETDDAAMLVWFKSYKRKDRYTKELEDALKSANVPYETEMCRSCGGKVKKLVYRVVEVYDE